MDRLDQEVSDGLRVLVVVGSKLDGAVKEAALVGRDEEVDEVVALDVVPAVRDHGGTALRARVAAREAAAREAVAQAAQAMSGQGTADKQCMLAVEAAEKAAEAEKAEQAAAMAAEGAKRVVVMPREAARVQRPSGVEAKRAVAISVSAAMEESTPSGDATVSLYE